jgi:IS1 family transposase
VFHDEKVQNVKARRVQVDEIWSFTYAKQKNVAKAKAAPAEAGDTWTWTAIEADSKLIISWLVGGRDGDYSTSYAERHNLNMRMQMRRFTRLTTGYSKKIENHIHMVALYTVWYNWIRTHKAHRVTPAMAAGLTDKLMDMTEVARLMDDAEMRVTIQQRIAALALPQSN